MKRIWQIAYSVLLLPLLWVAMRLLGLVNRKIRRGVRGRKNLFSLLETQVAHKLRPGKRVWFHASSMGEFEQAKPIIASLKQRHEHVRIIVTFFSPSGYEHSRKYALADVISYLPFDTQTDAKRFLDLTKPDIAVMIRYDIWPNHIWELRKRNIPILIANATMRKNTPRLLPLLRNFHQFIYNDFSRILTVSQMDVEAFGEFGLTHPIIEPIGDTRYDQVHSRSTEAMKRRIIPEVVVAGKKIVVAGSSWKEDEEVLIPPLLRLQERMSDLLVIVVPHEPTVGHLEELEEELNGKTTFIRFSALNEYAGERIIIVDSIGILLTLYHYAHIAFIGGSFRQNVHNVLEAAVYGIPVVYGPKHGNSQEAVKLAELGGGFVVEDERNVYRVMKSLLENETERLRAGQIANGFVKENIGATETFLSHLEQYLGT